MSKPAKCLTVDKEQWCQMENATPSGKLVQTCPDSVVLHIYLIFWQAHRLIPWPGRLAGRHPLVHDTSPKALAVGFVNTIWQYFQALREEYGEYMGALLDFGGQVFRKQKFSESLKQEIGHAAMVVVKYEAGKENLKPRQGDIITFSHTGGDPGLHKHPVDGLVGGTIAELDIYECLTTAAKGFYDHAEEKEHVESNELLWRLQNKEKPRIKLIKRSGEKLFKEFKKIKKSKEYFAPAGYGLNTLFQGGHPNGVNGGCANLVASILKKKEIDLYGELPQGGEFEFHLDPSIKGKKVPILIGSDAFVGKTEPTVATKELFSDFNGLAEWPKRGGVPVHFWDPSYLYDAAGEAAGNNGLLERLETNVFAGHEPLRPMRSH